MRRGSKKGDGCHRNGASAMGKPRSLHATAVGRRAQHLLSPRSFKHGMRRPRPQTGEWEGFAIGVRECPPSRRGSKPSRGRRGPSALRWGRRDFRRRAASRGAFHREEARSRLPLRAGSPPRPGRAPGFQPSLPSGRAGRPPLVGRCGKAARRLRAPALSHPPRRPRVRRAASGAIRRRLPPGGAGRAGWPSPPEAFCRLAV